MNSDGYEDDEDKKDNSNPVIIELKSEKLRDIVRHAAYSHSHQYHCNYYSVNLLYKGKTSSGV